MSSYPFNPTAQSGPNNVSNETQLLAPAHGAPYFNYLLAINGPFFLDTLSVTIVATQQSLGAIALNTSVVLRPMIDWVPALEFIDAGVHCAQTVCAGISFTDPGLAGNVTLNYLALGGNWIQSRSSQIALIAAQTIDPRTTCFEDAFGITTPFPVVTLPINETSFVKIADVISTLSTMATLLTSSTALPSPVNFFDHISNLSNPHVVTAFQLGLGNVPNWSLSTASQAAAGVATNLFVSPAGLAAALGSSAVLPAASPSVFGIAKLNLGAQAGDSSDNTKALTTQGLLTMKSNGPNAITALFSYERQILTFSPLPIHYPTLCLGSLCNNFSDLVNAVQTYLGFAPIQHSAALACIYLPVDMATPNLTLTPQ